MVFAVMVSKMFSRTALPMSALNTSHDGYHVEGVDRRKKVSQHQATDKDEDGGKHARTG